MGSTEVSEHKDSVRQVIQLVQPHSHVSPENVQCLMGYIVDLNVILNNICRTTAGNVLANNVQQAIDGHVRSGGLRDRIHRDISSFVTRTFADKTSVLQGDVVLDEIVELIQRYCAPPSPT